MKPFFFYFFFSEKSDIDENGPLNYHTTHKNYQNQLKMLMVGGRQFFEKKIFFSNEANFTLSGYANKQNCCISRSEKPQLIEERPLHSEKVTVWCALWYEGVIG